jgi:hypothetical protein
VRRAAPRLSIRRGRIRGRVAPLTRGAIRRPSNRLFRATGTGATAKGRLLRLGSQASVRRATPAPLAGCRYINHGRARAEGLGRSWRSGARTRRGHADLLGLGSEKPGDLPLEAQPRLRSSSGQRQYQLEEVHRADQPTPRGSAAHRNCAPQSTTSLNEKGPSRISGAHPPKLCCLTRLQSMEPLWSPVVATGGNQSQIGSAQKAQDHAKTVAVGCDQLPLGAHGSRDESGTFCESTSTQ